MRVIDLSKKMLFQHREKGIFISVDKKSIRKKNNKVIFGSMAKQHPVTKNWFEKEEQAIFLSREFEKSSPAFFENK